MALPSDQPAELLESRVRLGAESIYLLVSPEDRPANDFVREAKTRLVAARNQGITSHVRFIYAGAVGPMPGPGTADILGEIDADNIVAGAAADQPQMVSATALIEAA